MKKILHFIVLIFISGIVFSQPGQLDPAFGFQGRVITTTNGQTRLIALVLQPDGKIIALGDHDADFEMVRYWPDGSKDRSFGVAGIATHKFTRNANACGMSLLENGQILVAASTFTYLGTGPNDVSDIVLLRFNSNGTLDEKFGVNGIVTTDMEQLDRASSMAIQKDGKILITGGTTNNYLHWDMLTLRYLPDGKPDIGFDGKGYVIIKFDTASQIRYYGNFISAREDGKILIGGGIINDKTYVIKPLLLQFMPDGTLDNSFSSDGVASAINFESIYSFALQEDQKIIVSGTVPNWFYGSEAALMRFTANGEVDSSYGKNGVALIFNNTALRTGVAAYIAIQKDGKVLCAGYGEHDINIPREFDGMIRFTKDGKKDKSFGENGAVHFPKYYGYHGYENKFPIVIQPDGKILTGTNDHKKLIIFRLLNDQNEQLADKDNQVIPEAGCINIYPNPVTEKVFLKGLKNATANIKIMDMLGNIFMSKKLNIQETTIDVHNLKPGQYLISIEQENKIISIAFLKQ